ncbi:MAG: non-ribosomal peptide synthetase, partial [bacterium]|nr:non-ribosomal peptide synthetase [bacterium]
FLGRIDHQVKIRGHRIELGEIESQLSTHPEVKEAVVLAREDEKEDRYLCAYIVPHSPHSTNYREYLSQNLPDYMIPSYFVQIETIPLNPNGKLDRRALPEPEISIDSTITAPANHIEEELAAIWSELLQIEKEKIGTDTGFFELGGHSLKATVLISRIHKALDVKIPLEEVFQRPTIKELAVFIKDAAVDRHVSIQVTGKEEYYVLSSAQKRLYILQQLNVNSTGYNMPYIFPLTGEIDRDRLEQTFKKLIQRHESLRTSFHMVENEPVQFVHESIEFEIENLGINEKPPAFIRAFNLSLAPLLRVGLVEPSEGNPILLVDMHHIIADGASQEILQNEFMALYTGEELEPLRIQYKDYVRWQNSEAEKESIKEQETYWIGEFNEEIPVLDLPVDSPRPAVQSFEGNMIRFTIAKEDEVRIRELAARSESTLFMVLLTMFNVLLSKLSSQEDIVVG